MTEKSIDLLVVVLDANPVWWGQTSLKNPKVSFTSFVDSLMLFSNTFLMAGAFNQMAMLVNYGNKNHFVYPKEDGEEVSSRSELPEGVMTGKYEGFALVEETIREEIKKIVLEENISELHEDCILTGALSMALCYINKISKQMKVNEQLSPRILVVKGSKDNSSQYMNFMSVIFTAQKMGVKIDTCILDNDSILLKQASDHLGGTYLKLPQITSTLEFLLYLYLPNISSYPGLSLPPSRPLSHKAACFCHRKLINQGYICSVCLSSQFICGCFEGFLVRFYRYDWDMGLKLEIKSLSVTPEDFFIKRFCIKLRLQVVCPIYE